MCASSRQASWLCPCYSSYVTYLVITSHWPYLYPMSCVIWYYIFCLTYILYSCHLVKLNIGMISYRFEILNHNTNGAVPKDQWFQNEQYYLGHLCMFPISDIVYNHILLKFNPKCTHFTKNIMIHKSSMMEIIAYHNHITPHFLTHLLANTSPLQLSNTDKWAHGNMLVAHMPV